MEKTYGSVDDASLTTNEPSLSEQEMVEPKKKKPNLARARFGKIKDAISGVSHDRTSNTERSVSYHKRPSVIGALGVSNSLPDTPITKKQHSKNHFMTPKIDSSIVESNFIARITDSFVETGFFRAALNPLSPQRRQWHVLIFACILYNMISIPLRIGFTSALILEEPGDWTAHIFLVFDIITDMILYMHIILSFYTPYEVAGFYVTEKDMIFRHYLWGQFWIDMIATLPLYLYDTDLTRHSIFRLCRLIWVRKYSYFFNTWEEAFISEVGHFSMQFIKLIVMFSLMTHWIACSYMGFAYWSGLDSPWLPPHDILHESFSTQYIYSFYNALEMITNGSDNPTTSYEQLFVTCINLLSVFVVAIVIGGMSDIVARLNRRDEQFREKMDEINTFCLDRNLPNDLSARIRKHVSTWWKRKGGVDDKYVFEHLTPGLAREINVLLNQDIIQQCPLFQNCPEGFIHHIVSKLESQIFSPEEIIIKQGDIGHEMFFIGRGQTQIIVHNKVVGMLKNGDYFGEIALLEAAPIRTATIAASSFCDLFMLTRANFTNVTRMYPDQLARMKVQAALRRTRSSLMNALSNAKEFKNIKEKDYLIKTLVDKFKPIQTTLSGDSIFDTLDIADTMYFIGQGNVEIRTRTNTNDNIVFKTPNFDLRTLFTKSAKENVSKRLHESMKGILVGTLGESQFFGWISMPDGNQICIDDNNDDDDNNKQLSFSTPSAEKKLRRLESIDEENNDKNDNKVENQNTQKVHAISLTGEDDNNITMPAVIFSLSIERARETICLCPEHSIAIRRFINRYSTEVSYKNREEEYVQIKRKTFGEPHQNPFILRLSQLSEEADKIGFRYFSANDKRYLSKYIHIIQQKLVEDLMEEDENNEE